MRLFRSKIVRRRAAIAAGIAISVVMALAPSVAQAQCMTPPTFAGIQLVTNPGGSSCSLNLSWNAPTANPCGGTVTYTIYRSTSSSFTPSIQTKIGSGITGTTFTDSNELTSGVTYYYIVRASSSANGIEDSNTAMRWGTPSGTLTTGASDGFSAVNTQWRHSVWPGGSDANGQSDVILSGCLARSAPSALRFGPANCGLYGTREDVRLVLGGTTGIDVPVSATSIRLRFWHAYDFQSAYDGVRLYYTTTNPNTNWASTAGYQELPDVPTLGAPHIENAPYNTEILFTDGATSAYKEAWNGANYTYNNVVVNLDGIQGQKLWIIWRFKTDQTGDKGRGYNLDDLELTYGSSTAPCATLPFPLKVFTARAGSYDNGLGTQVGRVKLEWAAAPDANVEINRGTTFLAPFKVTTASGYGTHIDDNLTPGDTHTYSASVVTLSGVSMWKTVTTTIHNSTTPVKWSYSTGATALNPMAISGAIFTGSNDRLVHAINLKATGGDWPRTAPFDWMPYAMNAPAQGRLPVGLMNGQRVVLAGGLDGYLYCINANTGAEIWRKTAPGVEMIAAPPTAALRSSGTGLAKDLLLYGTRNSTGVNKIVAVDAANGNFVWQFDNGGATDATKALGIISGAPLIDAPNKRLWFTTRKRTGGSPYTLWMITFNDAGATAQWWADIGDSDCAPVLRNGVVYLGTNGGNVTAFTAVPATGGLQSPIWTYTTNDGPVKLGVMIDNFSNWLFASTTNKVWGFEGGPSGVNLRFQTGLSEIPNPSRPLYASNKLYVGAGDGYVNVLSDFKTGAVVRTTIPVVTGRVLGNPAMDFQNNLLHIGSDSGIIYAVQP